MSENKNNKLILAIDTTGKISNATIAKGNKILVTCMDDDDSSSSGLLNVIDRALKSQNLSISDMELLAYASGPGSFTGLRVGISIVKALSFALGKNCVGVPTLKAITQMVNSSSNICALIPFRKNELFYQRFCVVGGKVEALNEVSVVSVDGLLEMLKTMSSVILAGFGAQLYRDEIKRYAESLCVKYFEINTEELTEKSESGWYLIKNTNLSESVAILALETEMKEHLDESQQAIYSV